MTRKTNPDKLGDQLDRLRTHIVSEKKPGKSPAMPSRYARLAESLGGELVQDAGGVFCLVTRLYEFGCSYGSVSLDSAEQSETVAAASFSAGECEGGTALGDLVFFDTETTGLGGAGTVAFLIGCGSLTNQGFEVRQYVLPDYSDEAGMLERLLDELTERRTIVSYNGLAFDAPLVRDRMIVNRVARELPCQGHIDLLHATRRLFRRRLRDCSLTNIEREIFSFYREGDIPGYLIPSVYFDWLGTENPSQLETVLEHNRLDILSLYFLLLHVADVFVSEGETLESADDMYSLARVYGRRRQHDKVADMYERMETAVEGAVDPDALLYHSYSFKKTGDWEQAIGLWQQLSEGTGQEAFASNIELAKYFEHRKKDANTALSYARRAGQICPFEGPRRDQVRHRLARLQRKAKDLL